MSDIMPETKLTNDVIYNMAISYDTTAITLRSISQMTSKSRTSFATQFYNALNSTSAHFDGITVNV